MFYCKRCHYRSDVKVNYLSHLKRKNKCESTYSDIAIDDLIEELASKKKNNDITYKCDFCDKKFNYLSGKSRHKKLCKMNPEISGSNIVNKLEEKIKELEQKLNQPTTIINNNNITNIQNIQQNNIVLENFCKEDVEFISDTFIRRCLGRVANGFEDLTKKIHFNPNKPEYHNVTITNKKDPYLDVFKDNKWQFQDKNVTLDALIKQCFDILSSHYDKYEDEIKEQFSYTQLKQVDQLVDNLYNKDKSTQSKLRQYLYLVILNNRNIAKEKIERL
jgi:hypothetical protein